MSLEELWRGPMLVCKSWKSASTDFSLYTALDLHPFFESSSQPPLSVIHKLVERSQGYLSLLRTRNCSDATLSFVAQRCPNLKVLSIKSSPSVTDVSIAEISSKCVKLRELDLSYCCYISSESLIKIGEKCPNLTVLKRNFMKWSDHPEHYENFPSDHPMVFCQNGDSDATAIGTHMHKLTHLEIRFSELTVKGLEVVCSGCKDLVSLDLRGTTMSNSDIDRATQKLKKLKEVKRHSFYMPED